MSRLFTLILSLLLLLPVALETQAKDGKWKIAVVSSYHREYLWSQDTNSGVIAGLLEFKYLDSREEADKYTKNDFVESARAIIRKFWMDTKRNSSAKDMSVSVQRIASEINQFKPDLILLGDDNAANYIGNMYLDTEISVVFWGINGIPMKYGLLDSLERPGHNVTGVFQSGYLLECVDYLKRLLPEIKSMAILSDDSETGRSKAKELINLSEAGRLPLRITGTVITNSYREWKGKALALAKKSDSFFVLNHNTLKDDNGATVDQLDAGAWYLKNITRPDIGHEKQFVEEGVLLVVDDSGFKQGYESVKIAAQILGKSRQASDISPYAPSRGAVIVNRQRAKMLGLEKQIEGNPLIEEYIENALALEGKHD
jgi:putative ABC transport system substrate-binding protein